MRGYFDCFSGAAGDMILAAMLHAGLKLDVLTGAVARLQLPGVTLRSESVQRHGIAATLLKVEVAPDAHPHHRHLPDILRIVEQAGLSATVAARATHGWPCRRSSCGWSSRRSSCA